MNIKTNSLSGATMGEWSVGEEIRKNGKIYYKCKCSCGAEKDVYRYSLIRGDSKSCGCFCSKTNSKNTAKDKTGSKIGMFTLIERLPNYKNEKTYYRCICDCGNEKIISDSNITTGSTKSCGCLIGKAKRKDYAGKKFGMLTVIEMLYNYNDTNKTYAKCVCECGKEKVICVDNLIKERTKSCGCLEKESRYNRMHHKNVKNERFGTLTAIETLGINNNGHMIWKCLCDCGNIVETKLGDLTRGHVKSCGCNRYDSFSLDLSNKKIGYLTAIKPISGNKNSKRKWECLCDCNKYTSVSTSDLVSGNTISCGCYSKSKSEKIISEYLSDLGIIHISQYKFSGCKNIRPLPFDFYLPEYDILIEYQGEQHYKSVDYFGGEEMFLRRSINDEIKKKFCATNKIKLICLPYTLSFEQIKEIIKNIKNPVTTTA